MKTIIIVFLLCVGTVYSVLRWVVLPNGFELVAAYERIQGSLFTGFLTIGGFLLSLKTFLLLRLKQDIYDHSAYDQHFLERKALDESLKRYDPLRRLSRLLVFTVFCAIVSSVGHLTVGYVLKPHGPMVAISLSFGTLVLVFICWNVLSQNLRLWMRFIERNSEDTNKQSPKS